MKYLSGQPRLRPGLPLALLFIVFGCVAVLSHSTRPSQANTGAVSRPMPRDEKINAPSEPADVAAFRASVGGDIKAVIVELRGEPGVMRKVAAEKEGRPMSFTALANHGLTLYAKQEEFFAALPTRGVRALMREADVKQIDGSIRHVEYRFTYLLNGFVAYVATEDVERLRALPEVSYVQEAQPVRFHLDKAIDYILGTHTNTADRRTAVYGAAKEVEISGKQFQPQGSPGHPETPQEPNQKVDGYEGQGINVAVIDTGVDWRHPMFGGTGHTSPQPRVSGQAESPADNKKVIYYYALSSPGDITDDFGHGTHVASCVAGYGVDGTTPRRLGYGTGTTDANGLPGTGIGPTPNGVQLFGTAPQARIMAYKVCGPANVCAGDSELAMEDAASPFTLVASGDPGPTPVAKPVADVINLSLGDTAGDPAGTSARAANNAALAGTIVVASAGNAGPGAGTTGAPSTATLAISVAASLDPGSTPVGDVLDCQQITGELYAPDPNALCQVPPPAAPAPTPEKGGASNANAPRAGERQSMKLFPVAGGGSLPEGSVSAHYVFVDRRAAVPAPVPTSVTNRIAVVYGSGTFASIANPVAALNPAAILIVTTVESATAVVVVSGIPTFTIGPDNGNYLINRIREGDSDGADADTFDDVPNGTISQFPLRIADSVSLSAFIPGMAGFSSRGPNDFDTRFRTIKPDITGPGVGVTGAATPDGTSDETVGMATPIGYITVNGTSFSGPITAGAIAVVRQRVREELGLDSITLSAGDYNTKRFDTVTVARALLQNAATNLRSGLGVPEGDGAASTASINDMGSGLLNLDGALKGKAIMVAPTQLNLNEFTPRPGPSPQPSPTPMTVLIPTASFGNVPVVGVNATVTRIREVIIRDLPLSGGDGAYSLTFQNNRLADHPGFQISFLAADGITPTTSVTVPANGQTTFFVKTVADGTLVTADPSEFQWYVTATHTGTGQKLRMPFYYRAVRALIPNITSPDQQEPTGVEQPAPTPTPSCPVDTNGNYTVNWTYTKPAGGPDPVGFRVQEATRSEEVFFDNADEPLVAGANSKWADTGTPPQWTSQVNPDTGSLAYFIPNNAEQNQSLRMIGTVALPPGGASLSFYSLEETEAGFDFGHVEVATSDDNFINFSTIASFSGSFSGTRFLDLSPYGGKTIKIRFRFTSDLLVPGVGWYVEDIRVTSDDFHTIADTSPAINSVNIAGKTNGTYLYRIAALFSNPNPEEAGTTVIGPYSNLKCVTVSITSVTPTPTPTPTPTVTPTPTPTPTVTPTPSPTPTPGVTPTPTPTPGVSPSPTPTPLPSSVVQFSSTVYLATEDCTQVNIQIVRSGDSSTRVTVDLTSTDGTAKQKGDYTNAISRIVFEPGVTQKNVPQLVCEDSYSEGPESFTLALSNPTGGSTLGGTATATIQIADDASEPAGNPIDIARTFVCQHYHDFLARPSDQAGEDFWTNEIAICGTDPGCIEQKRINVSAAFFLSIEFQQTGYFVIRAQKSAFGSEKSNPRYLVFLRDQRQIAEGVVIGQPGAEQLLEQNKQTYVAELVSRPDFVAQFPLGSPAATYVDKLFANAGVTPTTAERSAAISAYGSGDQAGRAGAFRSVVDSNSIYQKHYNPAFVLMQYYGYLRRNPDDAPDNNFSGYDFWLAKLDQFTLPGEDVRNETVALNRVKRAEMVKAFLVSGEYRERFGGSPTGNQQGSEETVAETSGWRRELDGAWREVVMTVFSYVTPTG